MALERIYHQPKEDEMNSLKEALIREYGTMIEDNWEQLIKDFGAVVAARMFAGDQGDNPLAVLNRALDNC